MSEILVVTPRGNKPEVVENKDPVVTRIHTAITKLHSLKSQRYPKYWAFREEYAMRDVKPPSEEGITDYSMNTWFAIVNTKVSELVANTPKYDFIALDDEAKKYKRVRELHWKYVWETSRTDAELIKILMDSCKYWTGFWLEEIVSRKRKVKVPLSIDDKLSFKEETICDYEGIKLSHIPWNQVYINGSNIENTSEAIIITYWDRNEFLNTFWNSPAYSFISDESIPKGKYYYVAQGSQSLTINWSPSATDRWASAVENSDVVSVLTYYNKFRDEWIVLANDKWINPLKWEDWEAPSIMPIPYTHKEIPLVVYTDHYLEDNIYGLGELDITEKSRKLKNALRSLHIEWLKASAGIITIDPDSDYDETVMKLWMRQVARVEKDSLWYFAPSINLSSIYNAEQLTDEDLVVECGIDFKSQLLGQNETAERTKWRIAAAKKRISHNIKHNAYTFYERLARLRCANIQFFYWERPAQKLPVKWLEVDDNWNVEYVQNGYGMFTIQPEIFKWKLSLIPVMDSLYGDTSNEIREKYLQVLQLLLNMKDKDGRPTYEARQLIEAGRGIIDDVIDIDKVSWKAPDSKTPDDLLKEAWIGEVNQNPTPPDEVPPAQRSWAPILLGSSAKE